MYPAQIPAGKRICIATIKCSNTMVFRQSDLLTKLYGPLINIPMDTDLLRQLVVSSAEMKIEEWDKSKK